MRMSRRLVAAALGLAACHAGLAAQGALPPYRDAARSVDERAADLLARMTLDEKVAQLQGLWKRNAKMQGPGGVFDPAGAPGLLANGIGEIARPSEIADPPKGAPATRTAQSPASAPSARVIAPIWSHPPGVASSAPACSATSFSASARA